MNEQADLSFFFAANTSFCRLCARLIQLDPVVFSDFYIEFILGNSEYIATDALAYHI